MRSMGVCSIPRLEDQVMDVSTEGAATQRGADECTKIDVPSPVLEDVFLVLKDIVKVLAHLAARRAELVHLMSKPFSEKGPEDLL